MTTSLESAPNQIAISGTLTVAEMVKHIMTRTDGDVTPTAAMSDEAMAALRAKHTFPNEFAIEDGEQSPHLCLCHTTPVRTEKRAGYYPDPTRLSDPKTKIEAFAHVIASMFV